MKSYFACRRLFGCRVRNGRRSVEYRSQQHDYRCATASSNRTGGFLPAQGLLIKPCFVRFHPHFYSDKASCKQDFLIKSTGSVPGRSRYLSSGALSRPFPTAHFRSTVSASEALIVPVFVPRNKRASMGLLPITSGRFWRNESLSTKRATVAMLALL